MVSLCTLRGPQAPEQGPHCARSGTRTGLQAAETLGSRRHTGVRPSPAPVRPSPRLKAWTLSTPSILPTRDLPQQPHPALTGRRFFALKDLILPGKINRSCNLVLPALVTDSGARPHGALSLQAPNNDSTFMVRSADRPMTRRESRLCPGQVCGRGYCRASEIALFQSLPGFKGIGPGIGSADGGPV